MARIIKNFSVLFLWLAGLSTCAHLLIPHDHHLVESVTNQNESCPLSNDKTGHHTGIPVHCHTFNDIVSEKVASLVLKRNIHYTDLPFGSLPEAQSVELQISFISVFEIREPFSDTYLLKLYHLRAPPSLS